MKSTKSQILKSINSAKIGHPISDIYMKYKLRQNNELNCFSFHHQRGGEGGKQRHQWAH